MRPHVRVRFLVCGRMERPGSGSSRTRSARRCRRRISSHLLSNGVVLPGIGRDIGENRHLIDVGIILWIYALQFRMQCFVASAGQPGIAFIDLGVGITGRAGWCSNQRRGCHEGIWLGISLACGSNSSRWTIRRHGSVYPKASSNPGDGPMPAPSSFS